MQKCKIDRLQKYQNRAVRESSYDIRSSYLLEELNWKSLEERRKYLKSIFIYKILNGHSAPNLQDAFCPKIIRDNIYNLRNNETDLAPLMPKREFGKRSFSFNGAVHLNNLPHNAKIAESVKIM